MLKLGLCVTGSFCSMESLIEVIEMLKDDYEIICFVSPNVFSYDTRFYSANELLSIIEGELHSTVKSTIQEAEVYGPKEKLDIVLVYPCDSNTLHKLDYGINDNCVTMLVKSSLRNNVPIVLGINTNDALSNSAQSIGSLLNKKNFYLIPLYQDHYIKKPNSMIADISYVKQALTLALSHKQIQPVILGYKEVL